jgi:hypothetical protein
MRIGVDKDVAPRPTHSRLPKYPWHEMEIGDSFLVEDSGMHSIPSNASHTSSRTGRKFITQKVEAGIRVWRTA